MYRVSPLTYITAAMASSGIAGVSITCARNEIVQMDPPIGMTCESYLSAYLQDAGGTLLNPTDMHQCQLCPVSTTDDVLATLGIYATDGWRNLGISLVYTAVNIAGALLLYWLFRVPKSPRPGVRS